MNNAAVTVADETVVPRAPSALDRLFAAAIRSGAVVVRNTGGRGFSWLLRRVRRARGSKGYMQLRLSPDAQFLFPLADSYWSRSLVLQRKYEPEIEWLLATAAGLPFAMLDCGANMGYWSVLASSKAFGGHFTVAIEASQDNFQTLASNSLLNGSRFVPIHRAIARDSGNMVRLYGTSHAGRSLSPDWHSDEDGAFEEVRTVSLDDAAQTYLKPHAFPPFVKLDVEGVEIEALQGGQKLMQTGALIAYEDHGKDTGHAVSAHLLSIPNISVWSKGLERRPRRLNSLGDVAAIKARRDTGYNFFAFVESSPWRQVFEGAA